MATEPTDKLLRIAAKFSPKIRDALFRAYSEFLKRVPPSLIESTLLQYGIQGLADLAYTISDELTVNVVPLLSDTWRESGRMSLTILPQGTLTQAVVFDALPVGAISAVQAHNVALVREIANSTRQAIIQGVEENLVAGNNPRKVARDFRAAVGLTAKQEQAVRNYRTYLETLDPAALQRQLRDHRYDSTVARAIESGSPLSTEQISTMLERYRQRYVKYRAETIARTESLRAVSTGEYEALLAAEQQQVITPDLRRFWVYTPDERVRTSHTMIPMMNPMGVRVKEWFLTPLGPLKYPRDPLGTAGNTINCRCRVVYRLLNAMGQFTGKVPVQLPMEKELYMALWAQAI